MLKLIAKLFPNLFSRYEAARWSPARTRQVGALQAARLDIDRCTREELCRIAIIQEQNNPIVQRLADIWECYTVGGALQITPSTSDPEWNGKAKGWHGIWEQYPDVNSRQNFGTLCGLMSRAWFIQGEVFVIFVEGESRPGQPPFPRVQLVESRLCSTPPEMRDMEGKSVIDGVAIDNRGRPTGYWIAEENEKNEKTFSLIPADSVVHVFEPSRPGQYRGITNFHAVLNELRDLEDMHHFEMLACKGASEVSNVIKTLNGEMKSAASLIRSRVAVTNQTVTGVDVTENRASYAQQALGGRTIALKPGEDFQQFRSDRPGVATRDYWRYKTELACAGVGIPYCMAFPDTMQGTMYRGSLDLASVFFAQRFAIIRDAVERIYVRNMRWAKLNDRILQDAPGDWFKVSIQAPRACNVDVGYNSSATIAEMAAGLKSPAEIYGARGQNWREQMDSLNECLAYSDSIGLTDRLAKINAAQKAMADPNEVQDEPTFTK